MPTNATPMPLFVQEHGKFPYRWFAEFDTQLVRLYLYIKLSKKVLCWRILVPMKLKDPVPVGDLRVGQNLLNDAMKKQIGGFLLDHNQRYLTRPLLLDYFPEEAYFGPNGLRKGSKWGYRVILDKGQIEMGIQRQPDFVEYFLNGGTFYRGRLMIRLYSRTEISRYLTPTDLVVIGDATHIWWFETTATQKPLVLSRAEAQESTPRAAGFSGLPSYYRELLPDSLHFWGNKGTVSQAARWFNNNYKTPIRVSRFEVISPIPREKVREKKAIPREKVAA